MEENKPSQISFWTNRRLDSFSYSMDDEVIVDANFHRLLFCVDLLDYSVEPVSCQVRAIMNLKEFEKKLLQCPLKPMCFHDLFVEHGHHFLPSTGLFETINNEENILLSA